MVGVDVSVYMCLFRTLGTNYKMIGHYQCRLCKSISGDAYSFQMLMMLRDIKQELQWEPHCQVRTGNMHKERNMLFPLVYTVQLDPGHFDLFGWTDIVHCQTSVD